MCQCQVWQCPACYSFMGVCLNPPGSGFGSPCVRGLPAWPEGRGEEEGRVLPTPRLVLELLPSSTSIKSRCRCRPWPCLVSCFVGRHSALQCPHTGQTAALAGGRAEQTLLLAAGLQHLVSYLSHTLSYSLLALLFWVEGCSIPMLSTLFMKEKIFPSPVPPGCVCVCARGLLSVTRLVCCRHPKGRSIMWCWLVCVCVSVLTWVCHAMCAHNTMAAHPAE